MKEKRRCSQCGGGEGVIDLNQIEGGEVRVVHLCAKCAAEKGIQTTAALADSPLGGLLAAIGADPSSSPEPVDLAESACHRCGATLQDFRETGHLGCADCYTAFAEQLRELLRRLHGSAHHTGIAYSPPGSTPRPEEESADSLRDQLRRAIAAEAFEQAAEIRDRLRGLE
jgi:protein arginine kinase activator